MTSSHNFMSLIVINPIQELFERRWGQAYSLIAPIIDRIPDETFKTLIEKRLLMIRQEGEQIITLMISIPDSITEYFENLAEALHNIRSMQSDINQTSKMVFDEYGLNLKYLLIVGDYLENVLSTQVNTGVIIMENVKQLTKQEIKEFCDAACEIFFCPCDKVNSVLLLNRETVVIFANQMVDVAQAYLALTNRIIPPNQEKALRSFDDSTDKERSSITKNIKN